MTPLKTALVTGAGAHDGIGVAIARSLAKRGLSVAIAGASARIHDRAEELRAEGFQITSHVADLTKAEEVTRLRAEVGHVDVLVNNAGMGSVAAPALQRSFLSLTEADWDVGIDVTLKTAFLVTKAFLGDMTERGIGRIVNIASVTGPLVSNEGEAAYSAAKAGDGRNDMRWPWRLGALASRSTRSRRVGSTPAPRPRKSGSPRAIRPWAVPDALTKSRRRLSFSPAKRQAM